MSEDPQATPHGDSFSRFSRLVDGPLTILALLMIPLLVIPLVVELSRDMERVFLTLDYFIWAAFAVEYFVKIYLTPNRRQYFTHHIPDLVIVLIPFLRPLRILRSARLLRLLRLTRVAAFAVRGLSQVRAILRRRGLNYVLLVVLAVMILAGTLVMEFERGAQGSNIKSFPDAMWWAGTTVTTVGYGDRFPVTTAGRGVALALMITGIALFGVLTAAIAAFFVEESKATEPDDDIKAALDEIRSRIASIEASLQSKG